MATTSYVGHRGAPAAGYPGEDELGAAAARFIIGQRSRLHVALRCGFRLWQVLSPPEVAGQRRRWRVPAAVVADLAGWASMSSGAPGRAGGWRLGYDCAEAVVSTWCAADTTDASRPVMMPVLSTCIEAGVRGGCAAVGVPAALSVSVGTARLAAGHRLRPSQSGWLWGASAGGAIIEWYWRHLRESVLADAVRHSEAEMSRAFRLGQFGAMTEADSVVDEAQRALLLVDHADTDRMRRLLGGWKASLAAAMRDDSVFLSEVLLRWASLRNLAADLSGYVQFEGCSEQMVILSRAQAAELWAALDVISPAGRVAIEVDMSLPAQFGGQLRVVVGDETVVLPPDRHDGLAMDLAAVAFGFAAVLIGMEASVDLGGVHPGVAAAGAGAMALLGCWSHRQASNGRRDQRQRLAVAAVALTGLYTVAATTVGLEPWTRSGVANVPVTAALQGAVVVLATLRSSLSLAQRRALYASTGSVWLIGCRLLPVRPPLRLLLAAATWPLSTALAAANVAATSDGAAARLVVDLERKRSAAVLRAQQLGRAWVHDACREIVEHAVGLVGESPGRIAEDVWAEARRRIVRLAQRLDLQLPPVADG